MELNFLNVPEIYSKLKLKSILDSKKFKKS